MGFGIDVTITEKGKGAPKWSFDTDLNGEVTLEEFLNFTKRALITVSKDVLKEEQAKGFDKNPRTRVDNVFGKDEEMVKPLGKIEYFTKESFRELILFTYRTILKKAPVGSTGFYRNSNFVFYRGNIVARNEQELATWLISKESNPFKPGDIVRFVNVMPYARKLELLGIRKGSRKYRKGKGGKNRDVSIRMPNGTYFLSYKASRRKFKAATNFFKFQFLTGDSIGIKNSSVRPGFRTRFKKDQRPYLYPTIVLDFSAAGATQ